MDAALEQAAARWSRPPKQTRRNWWQHETVVRHVNRLICGEAVPGVAGGDLVLLRELGPFARGVSVACGTGAKEMALVGAGVVERFDLYEIAEPRIELGERRAQELGISDRLTWHRGPADFNAPADVDLVYWNNALHHMPDTRRAVAWSKASLRPGGTFYMNDFVGPDRMRWTDEMLDIAEAMRRALPPELCPDPAIGRPDPEVLAAEDPSECADSAAILDNVAAHFPSAQITPTGGLLYHLALRDVLDRIDDDALETLLLLDHMYAERGITHYAVAVAVANGG